MTEEDCRLVFDSIAGDISERCWCAGWMDGLEEKLRKVVEAGDNPSPEVLRYGQDVVTLEESKVLRAIALVYKWWEA